MAKSDINMLEGSIWDKILQFAIPLAITSIMQQLFNAADVAIVGQFVGKQALAAVGATCLSDCPSEPMWYVPIIWEQGNTST